MGVVPSITSTMVVPESIRDKVGPLPDVSSMNKDDLSALCMKLYDQSCAVFQEKYHMEQPVYARATPSASEATQANRDTLYGNEGGRNGPCRHLFDHAVG